MFYDPDNNMIVYDKPSLAECEGAIALDDKHVAFSGTLANLQRLRKLGEIIPAPLDYQYDWPGRPTPWKVQTITANFLVTNAHCCCFNDTGTGKTASALWAADYVMRLYEQAGLRRRALILAPLSCLDTVWKQEIFKLFWAKRKAAILYGDAKRRAKQLALDVDFYIVNYDGLAVKQLYDELQKRQDIQIVIVDEASAYKHHNTERHRKARGVLAWRDFLWLLTATPTTQGPENAYGIAKLVNNANGESFRSYQERVTFSAGPWKRLPRIGAHADALALMVPAVRFSIDDCMDLPECTVQRREVELSPEQAQVYKRLQLDAQIAMRDGTLITPANQAVMRGKLIQIVCGCVYDEFHKRHELDVAPRVKVLREVIEQCSEKVIVFAPLTSVIEMLYEKLKGDFDCAIINGSVTAKDRKDIFANFQDAHHKLRVIIADPQTMAHGLTLTAATAICWYGPTDKTELYLQGNKRIDRPGQTKTTTIIQIASTPVEHEIYRRLSENEGMLGAILKLVEEQRG